MDLVRASKFLSLVLRHHPERIGLKLDDKGWAKLDELIKGAKNSGLNLNRKLIEEVVRNNDKQRFILSEDGNFIRANQGHSVQVNLNLKPKVPPDILYHGTAQQFVDSIKEKGLLKGQRNHIHLSEEKNTAKNVGGRHGKPVILQIQAGQMHAENKKFYLSDNNVWLTEHVPTQYIVFP